MASWNNLPLEIQQQILHPICDQIVEDFENYWPKESTTKRVQFPPPLKSYHNLVLSCKSASDIIAHRWEGHSTMTVSQSLREAQLSKLEEDWVIGLLKKREIGDKPPPEGKMTYAERFMARVGKFWKSPEFLDDCDLVPEILSSNIGQYNRIEFISVLEGWFKEHCLDESGFRGRYDRQTFSLRCADERFIFTMGRYRWLGDLLEDPEDSDLDDPFKVDSVEGYFKAGQMWDPEDQDHDTMNVRMPESPFPLPQECEFEPDTWWCYHAGRYRYDPDEWYMFSYKEGKLFARGFRILFGPNPVEGEYFNRREKESRSSSDMNTETLK
jgi:hypothetical protein